MSALQIIERSARRYDVTPDDIRGPSRFHRIMKARHDAAFWLRTLLGLPYREVGELLGGRDPSTIQSSAKLVFAEMPVKGNA